MDLSERWPLPDSPAVRDELAAAYADPSRGYHDIRHLTEVLDRLDELATRAGDQTYTLAPIDVMTFDDDGRITSMRAFWSGDDMVVS